jgi:hypothetical protein
LRSEVLGIPPFNYQWYFDAAPLLNATKTTLVITNLSSLNAGNYWLVVTNVHGAATSMVANLEVVTSLDISTVPAISITGAIGVEYRLEYQEALGSSTNWTELATLILTNTPQFHLDYSAIGRPRRFYRVVEQQP